jgi:hypothetical protein
MLLFPIIEFYLKFFTITFILINLFPLKQSFLLWLICVYSPVQLHKKLTQMTGLYYTLLDTKQAGLFSCKHFFCFNLIWATFLESTILRRPDRQILEYVITFSDKKRILYIFYNMKLSDLKNRELCLVIETCINCK